jgi:hypothetical protein
MLTNLKRVQLRTREAHLSLSLSLSLSLKASKFKLARLAEVAQVYQHLGSRCWFTLPE